MPKQFMTILRGKIFFGFSAVGLEKEFVPVLRLFLTLFFGYASCLVRFTPTLVLNIPFMTGSWIPLVRGSNKFIFRLLLLSLGCNLAALYLIDQKA